MFKHYFELIHGIAVWPVISLSIFFTFFLGLLWWAFTTDKGYINDMKKMPLDLNKPNQITSSKN